MKRTLGATAIVLAALLLAGCSSAGSNSTPDLESGGFVGQPAPGTIDGTVEGAVEGAVGGTTSDTQAANRDIITTGSVSLTVKDPIQAAQDAVTITEQANGRVDSRTENPGTDSGIENPIPYDGMTYPIQPGPMPSAFLTLRIPSDELDRTLTELKKLGTVNYVSFNASDVSQQTQDLDARITSLGVSVDRLLSLMSQATNTTDLIAIEGVLSARQSELESLKSQRDYLSDQIDYSTLNLELYGEGIITPGAPDNFWTGVVAGWNALLATLGGALVVFGVALPWLIVLGAVGLIVLLIIWLSTRKRKAA